MEVERIVRKAHFYQTIKFIIPLLLVVAVHVFSEKAEAIPAFARQYEVSCKLCHVAFPRLNSFGKEFAANNLRMDGWREALTLDVGDEDLALPKMLPLAIRAQAFVQARKGEEVDPVEGPTGRSSYFDLQGPYLIKLLSSAPLSEHISYYFYVLFAEKGKNGEALVEDAWFRYDDLFGTGAGLPAWDWTSDPFPLDSSD